MGECPAKQATSNSSNGLDGLRDEQATRAKQAVVRMVQRLSNPPEFLEMSREVHEMSKQQANTSNVLPGARAWPATRNPRAA